MPILAASGQLWGLSVIAIISVAAGALDLSKTDWAKAWRTVALFAVSTILVAVITEEDSSGDG